MTNESHIKAIITEREHWLAYEQKIARITSWEYFLYGLIIGSIISTFVTIMIERV